MGQTAGYLVIFSQNQKPTAAFYDQFLNYVDEADPESERVKALMEYSEGEEDLQDIMWSEVLGELTPEERANARAYKLGV
ncbi:MAG TPA: hypothetical protein VFS17_01025 [Methylophilaceae bacterium]|nr:hypothetical protein [Methylophilaceae bacterium]